MLKITNLEFSVLKNTKLEKKILNGLDLTAKRGEFLVIIGGNGAGKSTLFNVLSGFCFSDSGTIYLEDENITTLEQSRRSKLVSIVMQDPKVSSMENMTILENMALAFCRSKKRSLVPFNNFKRRELFKQNLSQLNMGLEDRLDELVINLSGGQRQALSLCMALLGDAKLLLLDEICAALDPNMSELVMNLAYSIAKKKNLSTIMITHNMEHALRFADRLLVLSAGKVTKEFSKQELAFISARELIFS
jgi:putative ABC transport system ATP-binding protein